MIKKTRKYSPCQRSEKIGAVAKEARDETEAILNRINTTNQVMSTTRPIFQFIAIMPPKEVATPFPPLNLKKGE
jgi:hypothetical protein